MALGWDPPRAIAVQLQQERCRMQVERRWEQEDVVLAGVEHAGEGPPVVLIHGWCCDRSFLDPQIAHFAERGRHVIAPDLRGHGASSAGEGALGIELFAADVADRIEALDRGRAMIAGHSLGGVVALELANRRPELVERIALLDSVILLPPHFVEMARGLSLLLAAETCADTIGEFVENVLLSSATDPGIAQRAVETMRAADPRAASSSWESHIGYDDRGALKACPVPILFVAASNSMARLEELPDMNPALELVCMSDVSHFLPLEAPAAINDLLERFFRV